VSHDREGPALRFAAAHGQEMKMKRGFGVRIAVVLLVGFLMATSTGCIECVAVSNAVSFGAGWLLRDVTLRTTVERECYKNGVLVDCVALPDPTVQ
jgi:hypothetical protein